MTNCVNCGAVLHGNKCEYCGTEYDGNRIFANFEKDDYTGTIKLGNEKINVYVGSMESNAVNIVSCTTLDGRICTSKPIMKRKFTLIEI